MPTSRPRRPTGLGTTGRRFWNRVMADYDNLRADEAVVLEHACRVLDTIARLDAALADAPLTVRGSVGQERENPLLSEVRQQRMALSRLVRQLDLPQPDEVAEIRDALRSRRARAAARARWSA